MSRRGWVLFAAMGLIWGIPYLLIRVAVQQVSPPTLVFVRTGLAAVLLLPFAARQLPALLPRWRPVLAYTVVELAIPWLLLSNAEERLTSSVSGLLVAAVPIVGAAMVRFTGSRERLGGLRLTGLALGICGVAALVGFGGNGAPGLAFAEVAVVVVGYALGPLIVSRYLADVPSRAVVTASLLVTALAYAPAGIVLAPHRLPGAAVVASIALLACVCTAAAFLIFFPLISEVGPARATVITYVNPAVAVALGVLVLHEQFSAATAAGFVLVISGCVLATRGASRLSPGSEEPLAAMVAGDGRSIGEAQVGPD